MIMLILAQGALPDPNSFQAVGWVVIVLAGLMGIFKLGLDIWKDHFRADPPLHTTYLTRIDFDSHKAERKEDVTAIKKLISDLSTAIEEDRKSQKAERKSVYGRLNAQENALYYMAGKEEAHGNSHTAKVIRERLEHGHKES